MYDTTPLKGSVNYTKSLEVSGVRSVSTSPAGQADDSAMPAADNKPIIVFRMFMRTIIP